MSLSDCALNRTCIEPILFGRYPDPQYVLWVWRPNKIHLSALVLQTHLSLQGNAVKEFLSHFDSACFPWNKEEIHKLHGNAQH